MLAHYDFIEHYPTRPDISFFIISNLRGVVDVEYLRCQIQRCPALGVYKCFGGVQSSYKTIVSNLGNYSFLFSNLFFV